jgi:hypothetical protein
MQCPLCDELHREHDLACEEEATVSLQQRYELMLPRENECPDPNELQQRQEKILSSKKRQLRISSRLEQHRALAHSA